MNLPARASSAADLPGAAPEAASRPWRTPLGQLSTGPDGSAALARVSPSGELIELRYATVAQADPARWQLIERAANRYALVENGGVRRLLARELVDETPVLVFAAAPEQRLDALMAAGGLPSHVAWQLATGVAHALVAMHRLGLAHTRLGPSAVFVRADGSPQLDFAWLDVGASESPLDAGCAAPERGREPLDPASDVYSFGALLSLMFRDPVAAEGDASAPKAAVAVLLGQCLQREREARPSMADVCAVLDELAAKYATSRSLALQATQLSIPPKDGRDGSTRAWPSVRPPLGAGTRLGRFELLRKIGEGGMGEVFEAIDRASGERAALKVLRADGDADPARQRRFRKEARILSEIRSPHVANLIEWNRDAGVDYMALEYVAGGDLAGWRAQQGGRVHEQDSLAIVAEVCRGLGDAHARGIVHRDIKPQNIMIEGAGDWPSGGALRLKLCDFGIARALEQKSGTLAFTEHDKLLGTPDFMAPEQAGGAELTPATDVYALGVMLFSLIAGRLPFEAKDPVAMLVAHATRPAPKLSEVCGDVSEATSALVERMLMKNPVDRFADANILLEAIELILSGEPSTAALHPVRPAAPAHALVRHVFEFELLSSPEALWPYVSNTDRMNRAVGLPPADYERVSTALGVELRAHNRVLGVSLRWTEPPYEWVEGRRYGVLRVFDGTPMRWYTIELDLEAKPEGGTKLRYTMTFEPRYFFTSWLVAFEMRMKQRPALARVYGQIDAYLQRSLSAPPARDPFEVPAPLKDAQRRALARALERMSADGVKPELLDALAGFCEYAGDMQVAQLRPLAFAREHGLDPNALVDACLRGAYHGLFVLLWEVLCPLCRVPSDFVESLRALAEHGHCPSCKTDFPLDFAQSLELVFRVAPDVRASELRTYCLAGPGSAPHVVAQIRLTPGERLHLSLGLTPGAYKIRSPQLAYACALAVSPVARSQRGHVRFTRDTQHESRRVLLAPGSQLLELENVLEREIVVRVERSAAREDALTAARATCLPSFRKLFPGEVLASGRLVAVGRTAFVVAAIKAPRRLMRELGDARAFELMLKQIERIEEAVAAEGGALVKTASGATLCAFDSASAAARAALSLRVRLLAEARAAGGSEAPELQLVVHQGAAVAATVDGRLDYFGETVETALDLIPFATPSSVLLSHAVADDPHVIADLTGAGHQLSVIAHAGPGGGSVQANPRRDSDPSPVIRARAD